MADADEGFTDGPGFDCGCCGQCCRRDPYYAVSLLDIRNISMGLDMSPEEFFRMYCAVIDTPGGFRYPAILAPEGCPFLKGALCSIHIVKPIGCWVFPESALMPVSILKKSVTAIPSCAILSMPDDDRPLKADLELMAARDLHFEHTKKYFVSARGLRRKNMAGSDGPADREIARRRRDGQAVRRAPGEG